MDQSPPHLLFTLPPDPNLSHKNQVHTLTCYFTFIGNVSHICNRALLGHLSSIGGSHHWGTNLFQVKRHVSLKFFSAKVL